MSKGKTGALAKAVAPIKREIKRCPATILAANRMARVMGRIKDLMVSMTTIKGINNTGVPLGIKWTSELEVLCNQENMKVANHKGSAKAKVLDMWEKLVKVKGNSPHIFKVKIARAVVTTLIKASGVLARIFLNSLTR